MTSCGGKDSVPNPGPPGTEDTVRFLPRAARAVPGLRDVTDTQGPSATAPGGTEPPGAAGSQAPASTPLGTGRAELACFEGRGTGQGWTPEPDVVPCEQPGASTKPLARPESAGTAGPADAQCGRLRSAAGPPAGPAGFRRDLAPR